MKTDLIITSTGAGVYFVLNMTVNKHVFLV